MTLVTIRLVMALYRLFSGRRCSTTPFTTSILPKVLPDVVFESGPNHTRREFFACVISLPEPATVSLQRVAIDVRDRLKSSGLCCAC